MATKPVISFEAKSKVPVALVNKSLVAKKTGDNYTNKTERTDYVDTLYVHPSSDTYLYAKCQCGQEYSYVDKAAVPSSNLNCSNCSRKIIEYGS